MFLLSTDFLIENEETNDQLKHKKVDIMYSLILLVKRL